MTSGGRWSGITFGFPFLCLFYPETHRRCLRSSCGLLLLLLWQEFFRKEASLVTQEVKEPLAMQETQADAGSIPGSGRSPGGGHGNPLQYACLENLTDRGAWWATVHGVTKYQTGLKRLPVHFWKEKGTCLLRIHCVSGPVPSVH